MQDQVEAYIQDHQTAWSPTTLKSEVARLRRLGPLLNGTPKAMYDALLAQNKGAYTIKTTFIRVCSLEAWVGEATQFRDWFKKHRNRFKHVYQKEEVGISYEEALSLISRLPPREAAIAKSLLATGLRCSEVNKVRDGQVVGKGGKVRKVFGQAQGGVPRSTLARKLRQVGLKAHTLRKLCATRLVDRGASPQDLCKIMGWSSLQTAYQYLIPHDDERLLQLMSEAPVEKGETK